MIIAVWGNGGSGKSTLSIKLATSFARLQKNVVLIDTNYIAPQANVWYPKLDIKTTDSLTNLLDNNINNIEQLTAKIHTIDSRLGVLGYAKDYAVNSRPGRSDTAQDLFDTLREICDVVIVDCQTSILDDVLSFVAIEEYADERLIALTPDIRGLSWYDANVKMMEENWTNNNKNVTRAFNQTTITAPVVDIERDIGAVEYYIPYDIPIAKELYSGTLGGDGHRKTSRKYTRVIDSIAAEMLSKYTISVE